MQRVDVVAKDGVLIPTVFHEVDNEKKKAVVVICHGFGEHSGGYVEFAKTMWKSGYACVVFDQRGHGTPSENAKKFRGIIPSYQSFIDDVISVAESVRQIAHDVPIVLYGHSMGGNIAINTILRENAKQSKLFKCAVFEVPWLGLYKPATPLKALLIRLINIVAPNYTVSTKVNYDEISTDEEKSADHRDDPLNHSTISMRMLVGIVKACGYAFDNAKKLSIPTFLAYADNDTIVSNEAIIEFAKKAGNIVTIKEYESNHAIHDDKTREEYFRDIVEFLDGHCTTVS